jgi:hypothetical protein
MQLPSGLGNKHSACSIAAINLALYGRLTDSIPDCMSEVIGRWIIVCQDAMPDDVRNSEKWKSLLPLAAGTGREREQGRLKIILDWMWGTVLPSLQTLADEQGFGAQWQKMTAERTAKSANAAEWAARDAAARAEAEVAEVAEVVAAARVAEAASVAEWAEEWAEAAKVAARVAAATARAARATAWADFDPCGLLERLIKIDNNAQGAA